MARELPAEPDFSQFKDQKRTFKFFAHEVDTERLAETDTVEIDAKATFVGVVQVAQSPTFRALFVQQTLPSEAVAKEYDEAIQALLNEAKAEGVEIHDMDGLKAWVNGAAQPEVNEPLDFERLSAAIKENEDKGG